MPGKRLLTCFVLCAAVAFASSATDLESLKPPKGSKVALVVFEDLECPTCGQAHPQLEQLSKQYGIPLLIHDFPLQQHAWAMPAAILAQYFESRYSNLGREFRSYIFQNQSQISAPCEAKSGDAAAGEQCRQNLRSFAQKFAQQHKMALPFALDPQQKLENRIVADRSLGQRVGVEHTPTIYITTSNMTRMPYETPL